MATWNKQFCCDKLNCSPCKKLKTSHPSDDSSNAADIDEERSAVESHHETDQKNFEPDDETRSSKSDSDYDEDEELDHPSDDSSNADDIDEERSSVESHHETDANEVESDDETENYKSDFDSDEEIEHQSSQLHSAVDRGDTEAVRSLLTSSVDVDVLSGWREETLLHVATRKGHIDIVDLLLRKNANVNSRDLNGWTPLYMAAEYNHVEIPKILLKNNADIHVASSYYNKTPYDIAKQRGHCEIVQLLMSTIKYPSLHIAASCGNAVDVQQILLNLDANPNVKNLDRDTPLHLASRNGHLEVIEVLLRNNADANTRDASFNTPLHIAAERGHVEIVKAMVDYKCEVNAIGKGGNTALHLAASNGDLAVAKVLLNHSAKRGALSCSKQAVNQVPPAELELSKHPIINAVDVYWTSNPIAAEGGNVEISNIPQIHSSTVNEVRKWQATQHVEIQNNLTFNGANVNLCNIDKMTPLHLASQNGYTSVVEILLDNHATVDVTKQSEYTPFSRAVVYGHAGVTDLLLHRGACDFVLTGFKETPLHVAIERGHTDVVDVILKHSRRIYEKMTKDGKTLHENTKRGVMPVKIMSSDGRRVSAEIVWTERHTPLEIRRDYRGFSPLVHAAFSKDPKMVDLLLGVDECLYSELDIADSFYYIATKYYKEDHGGMNVRKALQFLINSSKLNVQDKHFNFILHDVLRAEKYINADDCIVNETQRLYLQILIEVIQLLLEQGADFNKKNSKGETPLMIASEKGYCEAIQTLFDWEEKSGLKVDIDARDRHGATALIKAALYRRVSVMRLLLKHKASVNLYDYSGFTALHSVFSDPNRRWFDLHILRKRHHSRNLTNEECLQSDQEDSFARKEGRNTEIYQLWEILKDDEKIPKIDEEIVNLLLDNDETDVNARDFGGNTPLDLAMKSSKPLTSATFNALRNRKDIRNLLDLREEQRIKEAIIFDEAPICPEYILFHLLIFSPVSYDAVEYEKETPAEQRYGERCGPMDDKILQRQDTFRKFATAKDDKGRIPLHYAVMPPLPAFNSDTRGRRVMHNLVKAFLKLGSNLNAADIYGKTPLHYAESNESYFSLVASGASEKMKDKKGHTPKKLERLRYLAHQNKSNAFKLINENIGLTFYNSTDFAKLDLLNANHVTELSKQKLVETIRIRSQSPRRQESSEETIWKIWIKNDFFRLNRRLSQLNTIIHEFFERLADGIKKKDWRFECQSILVGSAEEETKVLISGDFDLNLKLIKFSRLCDPCPHPLGPKGYFQLKRKPREDAESRGDDPFDCFFNSEQCLMTNEVNFRFHITLEDVLSDHNFWQDENCFQGNVYDRGNNKPSAPPGLCKTLQLRMINPIEDGEGGFLFIRISIDVVACVHVEEYCPEDSLKVGINPTGKTDDCRPTFVFAGPRFDPSDLRNTNFPFSDTYARISFAQVESRIIKKSSPLIKAAYMVCKSILCNRRETTYQLKTSLLFCMESLYADYDSGTRKKVEFTQKQLAFWVERIMFCFMEFSRHYVFPLYLMPSFIQKIHLENFRKFKHVTTIDGEEVMDVSNICSRVFSIYLNLFSADVEFEIPVFGGDEDYTMKSFNACHLPRCESFDREEFIRKLSSRRPSLY